MNDQLYPLDENQEYQRNIENKSKSIKSQNIKERLSQNSKDKDLDQTEKKMSKEKVEEYLSKLNFITNSKTERKINKRFANDYEILLDYTEKLSQFIPKEKEDYMKISVITMFLIILFTSLIVQNI